MFDFIRNAFPHLRSFARSSLISCRQYGSKINVESPNQSKKKDSFVVSYLVNTCGFSPERAVSASNYVKFESPEKPDSVLSFLKNQGFTESQVSIVVHKFPPILLCDPHNTLLPKIEFFKNLGFTEKDFAHVLCDPGIFRRSLENQLLPTFDFLKKFLSSPEKIRYSMRRCPLIFFPEKQALMEKNIQFFNEMGVPDSKIEYFVQYQPNMLLRKNGNFRKIIEEVQVLGIGPSQKSFMLAVHVFSSMSKLNWEKKMGVYKKWGLKEDDILEAFRRNPWFMSCSEEKIMGVMDYIVNRMGFKSSLILINPFIMMYSLKKRTIPRCYVLQTLSAEGLLVKDFNQLLRMMVASEEKFLKDFVQCYKKQVPELQKQYSLLVDP